MPKSKEKIEPPGEIMAIAMAWVKTLTLEQLHKDSGLPISWLRKIRAGEIKNPSVNRIEKLLRAVGVSNIPLSY